MMKILWLLFVAAAACCTNGFLLTPQGGKAFSLVIQQPLWGHFVPREENVSVWDDVSPLQGAKNGFLATCLAVILALPTASLAVSGGGLDFANLDITGQDFSNKNYKGKDFTQVRNEC